MKTNELLEVIPDPVSLMESMRAVGYTAEAAVADIIDNSLSAGASQIHVLYDASGAPFVAIYDNGCGMSQSELTNAMRHGSTDPSVKRAAGDLGRFGLGLKTASLSQCRKLTVVSKKDGITCARQWDLDVVRDKRKWVVVVPQTDQLSTLPMFAKLQESESGTLVVWEDLDRLTAGSRDPQQEMTSKMSGLYEHLALVFHRFTEQEERHPAVLMIVNGRRLPARDPFLGRNTYRQQLEGERIDHARGTVRVMPYVLPPVSNLTQEEIETAGGREGLRGTQGFYVYRNRRLVIWGTWFRLVPKEEFYKLTRVRVDIPNSFDDLWALDIKKSAAYPPEPIRVRLKELIPHFANTSKRAITYRGRVANGEVPLPIWNRIEGPGALVRYEPNPEHRLILAAAEMLDEKQRKLLNQLLTALAVALPYEAIYADMCRDTSGGQRADVKVELVELAVSLREATNLSIEQILEIDPICRHPALHAAIREELQP